jgi:glyceraldehyde-3-phosphate dehydrogenase (ferredoxin)
MAIMGKYYNDYGKEFISPRELGRRNAHRMINEIMLDNTGICRFHRAWAEDIMPDIIDKLFGQKEKFMRSISLTASRINSRNASVFWESKRNIEYVYTFLQKKKNSGDQSPELQNGSPNLMRIKRMLPSTSGTKYIKGYMSHSESFLINLRLTPICKL